MLKVTKYLPPVEPTFTISGLTKNQYCGLQNALAVYPSNNAAMRELYNELNHCYDTVVFGS